MPSLRAPIHTITAAKGGEFACHAGVASAPGTDLVLAAPDRFWELDMDEHTNGFALKYFPKSARFRQSVDAQVRGSTTR